MSVQLKNTVCIIWIEQNIFFNVYFFTTIHLGTHHNVMKKCSRNKTSDKDKAKDM